MKNRFIEVVVSEADRRLDQNLAQLVKGLSRNEAKDLLALRAVSVNGKTIDKGAFKAAPGAVLRIDLQRLEQRSPEQLATLDAKQNDLALIAAEADYAIVRKPAGLPSTAGHFGDAHHFAAYALALLQKHAPDWRGDLPDLGLVHRLDNGTSGACAIARTEPALRELQAQRDDGRLSRQYLAIVDGVIDASLELALPIAHHPSLADRMVVVAQRDRTSHRGEPQPAHTRIERLGENGRRSLVRVDITGGRRHQIRVHLAYLGHAVCNDPIYGRLQPGAPDRLGLHAWRLRLHDLSTRAGRTFDAEPGAHFWSFAPEFEAML